MVWDHTIELLPNAPKSLVGRLLRLPQDEIREIEKFTVEHPQRGTIRAGKGPYAASFFFVKKANGKLQPVEDYRPLNKYTKKNRNVSPLIPQVIDQLAGCTLSTKFDIRWGYNNIMIKEGDEWKAAFLMPQGLFEPLVMFFGLTNSLATFQAMMNEIFRMEVAQGWLSVYMDNIAIHTKPLNGETEQQHEQRHKQLIHQVPKKLETHDLYLKPEKCEFLKQEIKYLGVIARNGVLKMNPKKLESIKNWAIPNNPMEIQKFLGFTGYYRYLVPNYSQITRPLLHLRKKTTPWEWTKAQQLTFDLLKALMCKAPVLIQPNFQKKFFLQVDASAYSVGTVLSQEGEITTPSLEKC